MSYKQQVLSVYPSARTVRLEGRWAVVDGNSPRILTSGCETAKRAWESCFYAVIFQRPVHHQARA